MWEGRRLSDSNEVCDLLPDSKNFGRTHLAVSLRSAENSLKSGSLEIVSVSRLVRVGPDRAGSGSTNIHSLESCFLGTVPNTAVAQLRRIGCQRTLASFSHQRDDLVKVVPRDGYQHI